MCPVWALFSLLVKQKMIYMEKHGRKDKNRIKEHENLSMGYSPEPILGSADQNI